MLLFTLMQYQALGICYAVTIPCLLSSFIYFTLIISLLHTPAPKVLFTIGRPLLASITMVFAIKAIDYTFLDINPFFTKLTGHLRMVFNDPGLELKFIKEQFDFRLVLSDKREITFNQLSP